MTTRPAKRARSSTTNVETQPAAVDSSKIPDLVSSLSPSIVANLLKVAAETHPDVATTLKSEADRVARANKAKIVNFDHLSKSAWKTLNVTYERMSGSHAYELSGEASSSIEKCFKTIQKQCPATASFRTKENALETLRKIGKSICLSTGVIPREIRKDYGCVGSLTATMVMIARSLEDGEKDKLQPWCDDKLVELQDIAEGYGIFEDLGEVIDIFSGEDEIEDDDQNSGDQEGEDEEDFNKEDGQTETEDAVENREEEAC